MVWWCENRRVLLENLSIPRILNIQQDHDVKFHSDITNLPPIQIVKHMTHHLVKYGGQLISGAPDNSEYFLVALTDAFIVTLSAAVALQYNLDLKYEDYVKKERFDQILETSAAPNDDKESQRLQFVFRYYSYLGLQSKALEAWDHLEDYPFRKILQQTNQELHRLIVQRFSDLNVGIYPRYRARLDEVEKKHLFYDKLRPEPKLKEA